MGLGGSLPAPADGPGSERPNYASLGRRSAAFVIDYVIAMAMVAIVALMLQPWFALLARRGESGGVAYDGGLVYGTWAVTIVLAVWSAIACSSDLGSRPLGLHVGLVVLRILGFLLGVAAYVVVIIAASGDWRRTGSRSLEVLVAGHIVWLYSGVMESSFTRGTLGKMMLGMIVTDAEGGRISFVTAVGRAFGRFVAAPLFFLIDMTERQQGSTT